MNKSNNQDIAKILGAMLALAIIIIIILLVFILVYVYVRDIKKKISHEREEETNQDNCQ